jgi:hypothetical protein
MRHPNCLGRNGRGRLRNLGHGPPPDGLSMTYDCARLVGIGMQFVAKTLVEVAFLPVTVRVVAMLKRAENEDYYDRATDFNPFKLET